MEGSGTQVEGSGTRLKDVEFLTQVEYTLIFNFGGMYELISSVKYDIKNPDLRIAGKSCHSLGRFPLYCKIIHDIH